MRNGRLRRRGAVARGETHWPCFLGALVIVIAISVGQSVAASARELLPGELKVSFTDARTVRMAWRGPIAAPMAQQIREAFENHKDQATRFVLLLSSEGGSVADGERVIEMLRQIKRSHELETIVPQGEKCASMCVFIYVQGQTRYGALTSVWLFHEVSHLDPVTKRIVRLDRLAWDRLIDKYFRTAGVSEEWIVNLQQLTVESDYWQTGADLIQSNSGIIHKPLGNRVARNTVPSSRSDESKSARPSFGGESECRRYFVNIGEVMTVPCPR